jgi:hypothetical protein
MRADEEQIAEVQTEPEIAVKFPASLRHVDLATLLELYENPEAWSAEHREIFRIPAVRDAMRSLQRASHMKAQR